jgi:FtsH-binding integral membrane protein
MPSPEPVRLRPVSRFSPRPPSYDAASRPVSAEEARATFLTRTYLHLLGAILLFTLLEFAYFATGLALPIAQALLGTSWLVVLGGFVVVSWLATRVAHAAEAKAAQYAALGGYVVAESLIFVPLLLIAEISAPGVIRSAALVTLFGFTALTVIVHLTRRDFSFLGTGLAWAGVVALMLIAASVLFGFALGTLFSVAMIGIAGASILHDTSKVLLHYPEDRYVGASLELFASVALLFWYVVRLLSRR